jgi:hypothetical protein
MKIVIIFYSLCFYLSLCVAQNNKINWSAFDMGFAISSSSTTTVKSSVGQTFVGISASANSSVTAGILGDTLFRGTPSAVSEPVAVPTVFTLYQNYPNPFNPTTKIRYELQTRTFVKINVFNVLGQFVKTLVNEEKPAGTYDVQFDASDLSSGIYFYRIETKSFVDTKKLVLLR